MLIVKKNSKSYLNCRQCNTVILASQQKEGEDLCLKCRSEETDCAIDAMGRKELFLSVPWCLEKNKRIFSKNSVCKTCKHYTGKKKAV